MPRMQHKALSLAAAAAAVSPLGALAASPLGFLASSPLVVLAASLVLAQSPSSAVAQGREATTVAGVGSTLGTLDPAMRGALAATLSAWIKGARNEAVGHGVETIPAEIRALLTGYLPMDVLDRARWRIDDSAVSVQRALFQMGYTPAVTLDDVILFATPADASDPKLWAHELYHVMQYLDWGVDGFANRYLADHAAVEHDAAEFRWAWMKATGRTPPPAHPQP